MKKSRATILRRDQLLFLQYLLSTNDREFNDFLQGIGPADISKKFVRIREYSKNSGHTEVLDTLKRYLLHETQTLSTELASFITFFAKGWESNQTVIGKTPTPLSTNFFQEVRHASATEEDLQTLLSQNEIVGYFVLPEALAVGSFEITFQTSTLTPRYLVLDLVNWYRSNASEVIQETRMRELGFISGNARAINKDSLVSNGHT